MKRIVLSVLVVASQILSCAHKPAPQKVAFNPQDYKRLPNSDLADTPWTTWSTEKKTIGGLLALSKVRKDLLNNNLSDPHASYLGLKYVECEKINVNFRTADGTCTDLKTPMAGAAGVAFGRNVTPEFIDHDAKDKLMEPHPATVAKEFFTRDEFKPVPFLNMLAASWIQFMNHDWLSHGKNMESSPYVVKMTNGTEMVIEKTKENPTSSSVYKKEFGKVSLNDVTHWWDGSQIYGSSQAEQNALRSFSRGKLATEMVNGKEVLPKRNDLNIAHNKQNQGLEKTGFKDNWWIGLSMLHTLFVKEHNAIADMLLKKHVKYDKQNEKFVWTNKKDVRYFNEAELDEHVFQTARLINAAIMAKIHTIEWTPAILPNKTLKIGMHINWYGGLNPASWLKAARVIPGLNKTDWNEHIRIAYLADGIVGGKTNNNGVPFSITEEFTSVYRLHSLLPETLNFKRLNNKLEVNPIPFIETRNEKSYAIATEYDLKDQFYSFGTQNPGQLVLNNFPKFMQELEIPGHGIMDLGMVDIMRDRERGVPRYNQFRRGIGLKPIRSYSDFFPPNKPLDARQMKVIEKFVQVYGKDSVGNDNVEAIDLLVGTLSEEVRPKNFGFGETMFQIFILMASRRLMADRFFTESYTSENYTKSGLDWIDDEGTMAKVIVRHMPELKPHLKGIETAFNPWKK